MSDPDWGRAGVTAPSAWKTLGDPTRWGTSLFQAVPFTAVGPHVLRSTQLIQVACKDPYARNWSLAGVVGANTGMWLMPDGTGPNTWSAQLSVQMGVTQNTIVHNINLRAVIDADAPFYGDSPPMTAPTQVVLRVRPFVIPGALVSNQISIQVVHTVQYALPPLPPGDTIFTAVQIAPIAPGAGL